MDSIRYALVGAPVKWLFRRDYRAQHSKANFHFKECAAVGSDVAAYARMARKILQVVNAGATVDKHDAVQCLCVPCAFACGPCSRWYVVRSDRQRQQQLQQPQQPQQRLQHPTRALTASRPT
jgi:hypothetical protein